MTEWQKNREKEFKKEKYVRDGTELSIEVEIAPKTVKRKGRYGERELYVLQDKFLGTILLSPKQFLKIATIVGNQSKGICFVTL